jgi:hypothetical protein
MRKFGPFILVFIFTFCSCRLIDPCLNLDCAGSNFSGQFRMVNAGDGSDLVFGSNAVYDKNKIQFYSLKGTDTSFFDYSTIKFPGAGYDSILNVNFYRQINVPVYIKLSDSDTDTLTINYQTLSSKCCGTSTKIKSFNYNNSIDIPGDQGT